jgi:hypothetical protein
MRRCFYYEYITTYNNETGEYTGMVVPTAFGQDKVFQHVYIIYLYLIFMFLVTIYMYYPFSRFGITLVTAIIATIPHVTL